MEVKDRDRKEDLKYSPTFDGGDNGFRESVPSHTVDQSNYFLSLTELHPFSPLTFSDKMCKTCHHIFLLEVQEASSCWRLSQGLLVGLVIP